MKKWIIIGAGIVLILLWQAIDIYATVQTDKKRDQAYYEQFIPEQFTIEEVQRYHGEERYIVFTLRTKDEQRAYYFVSESGESHTIYFSDIRLDEEEAISKVKKDNPEITEIARVTPAYSGQDFAWEIIALDEHFQYQYIYYSMTKGTYQKKYTLKR